MINVLEDMTSARLAIANEENLSALLPVFGKLGEYHEEYPTGVKRSITSTRMPLFNSIMDTRLASGQVHETIEFVLSDARKRKTPIRWWTGPSTQPADLGKTLECYGFTHDGEAPGMGIELATLDEELPAPSNFYIWLAQEDSALFEWSHTMLEGFGALPSAEFAIKCWHDLLCQADTECLRAYTGFLNHKPVATSLLFMGAGVAGIYNVSTLPEARRKGIGALMTHFPLIEARSLGYQVGVLQASDMGMNIYRSLGFQECCRITTYRWHPT